MEVNQLILARSLVDTPSDIIPLWVLNPTDYPCTLYEDNVAAMCEPVDRVEAPQSGKTTWPSARNVRKVVV